MNYVELARQKALKYGLNPDLFVRQIQAESSFNPKAVSSAGAIGLGQIMPNTAKELGINPEDPDQNLDGAARYMRQQLDTFGDYPLALAAYNAGARRVREAGGIPNITETQNYVSKIMGTGGSAMNANPMGTGGLLAASQAIEEEYKQEQADKPLFQRDSFKDMAGDMAILFNSMRMEPDDNIVQAVNSIKNKRTEKQARNKTVELMKRAGRDDLAAAAEAGVLSAKEAYATMLSDASKIRERQAAAAQSTAASSLEFERQKELIGLRKSATDQQLSSEEKLVNLYRNAYPNKTEAEILEMAMSGEQNAPAAFQSLHLQALAAGLVEGSPEYQNFMLTRGAGEQAAARLGAKQVVGAPAAIEKANSAITAIDSILENPNLAGVTGKYEGQFGTTGFGSMYFSQDEIDLIKDIDNLGAKVFLEAFETLKGGGQITEREGRLAQEAMENLSRQQSPEKLRKNMRDLKDVILKGQERARNKIQVPESERYTGPLGANYSVGSGSAQEGGATKTDPSGRKYRLVDRGNGVKQKVYE